MDSVYSLPVIAVVMAGLWTSNLAYDRGIPHYITRKIGHFAGGLGFIASVILFSGAIWPIVLSGIFAGLLYLARRVRPRTFRGVGGAPRMETLSEVWFAFSAVPVFAVAWLWLDRPLIALACLLFMAWGDCVTGIIRARVYHRPTKGLWGSLGMLLVCTGVAAVLVRPFWIGMVGAMTATITEWAFGDYGLIKKTDDNWAVPIASLVILLLLLQVTGNL